MPMSKKERGERAEQLIADPIMKDAFAATRDWAMEAFGKASTPEEAWNAKLRIDAVEMFSSYLLATIAMGRSEVDELVQQREKMSERKRRKQELDDYLDQARLARLAFLAEQENVA